MIRVCKCESVMQAKINTQHEKTKSSAVRTCKTNWLEFLKLLQVHQLTRTDIEDRGKIGNGITGEVYRVLHKPSGQFMAVKVLV